MIDIGTKLTIDYETWTVIHIYTGSMKGYQVRNASGFQRWVGYDAASVFLWPLNTSTRNPSE